MRPIAGSDVCRVWFWFLWDWPLLSRGMPTLRDILIYVSEFLGFWLEVFGRSASDLLRIVFHSPIPVLVFLALLSGIGLLAKYRVAGPEVVKEKLTYVFVPW